MFKVLALVTALGFATPLMAQTCPQPVGWAAPERHRAARTPNLRFALKPDSAHQLDLARQGQVKLAVQNGRKANAGGYAGLAAIDVPRAGTLDVLLSARAFVDLVRDGRALPSASHGRLQCDGIYKRVSFAVTPGRYTVQLTESERGSIRFATVMTSPR